MTYRERFINTMRFGATDRPPYHEWVAWPETYDRWYAEGYPKRADYRKYFGFDRYEDVGIDDEINPVFAEEIIEETETHIIKTDWRGVQVKLAKASRSIPYFYRFPVTDKESFRQFAKRLDASCQARYPHGWDLRAEELRDRDFPVYLGTGRCYGFFGPIREWVGPERLLMAFYDDPSWVHEMMDYYADFLINLTLPMLETVTPDCVHFFEDMAYRGGPLISPEFFREFMMEPYSRVLDHFRRHGVEFFMIDTDGNVEKLIPLFIELGITGMYPFEVQAGMDIIDIRRRYGTNLVIWGGLDKRTLSVSRDSIRNEVMTKVPFMLEQGGYIPKLDHEVPPDVPFDNFRYYRDCIRDVCERGAL